MVSPSAYLFVYGTLRATFSNPAALQLRQYSQYIGEGTMPGLLYDIGSYPGALYRSGSGTQVHGSVYELLPDNRSLLATLDDYEGVSENPLPDQPDEYIRAIVPINVAGQSVNCWAYLYNWPVSPGCCIASGDYARHLNG